MTLALTTIAVAVLAYLVGRALLPSFVARRSVLCGSLLQLELLLGNTVIGTLGLLLAELGVFDVWRLLALSAVLCLGARGLRRLQPADLSGASYDVRDVAGVVLVAGTWLWAAPPFDTALFASDASLYLSSGVHIADHGSFVVHDPTLQALAPARRAEWFPSYRPGSGAPPYLRVGGGLLLEDLEGDRVLPAFQPLLSVWVAIFHALGGDAAAAGPITYFAALFVWAFASFAARLAGVWTAGLAVVLLTSLVPQYWYSRFLMPEVPSQYLLWAGLVAGAISLTLERGRLGVVAGLAIGAAGLMRLDMLAHLAAGLALSRALTSKSAWPAGRGFVPALAAMAAYAIAHLLLFPTHYLTEILSRLLLIRDAAWSVAGGATWIAGALVLALALLVAARRGPGARSGLVRLGAAAAFAVYAAAIVATARPDMATNLAWLQLYVGWPIIGAGALGAGWWILNRRGATERFVLIFGLVAIVQLFFYPPVSPQPLWAIRRFVRIALPLTTLAAALAVHALVVRWRWPWRWLVSAVMLVALLGLGPRLAFTYRAPTYVRSLPHVRSMGALLPRGAVIVGDPAFFLDSQLHTALWLTRATPAFAVPRVRVDQLGELRAALADRPMFWIGPPGRAPEPAGDLRLVPVATYRFPIATRRMEPFDPRDDLGWRDVSVVVLRVERGADHGRPDVTE